MTMSPKLINKTFMSLIRIFHKALQKIKKSLDYFI